MEKTMDTEMIRKIDSVLDRVKELTSNLSVGELGIVRKFRYNESKRCLYIYANTYHSRRACCFVMTKLLESEIFSRLKSALQEEFPELAISFV
jgi:hypothetical protein